MQMALSLLKEFKDRPPVRNAKIVCRNSKLSAPISEKDADHGTSVEQAIDTWCGDNDGKDVGSDGIYWRWGITQLGVSNRSSFWLRAAKTCDKPEKFNKLECKKALTDGMKQCDKGPETHGHAASVDCLDYSIDLAALLMIPYPLGPKRKRTKSFPHQKMRRRRMAMVKAMRPTAIKEMGGDPLRTRI
jgi:hypothetical protein